MKKILALLALLASIQFVSCMQKSTVLTAIDDLLLKEAQLKAVKVESSDQSNDAETIRRIPAKLALIAPNPDVNATDDLGNTRLHYAAFFANFTILNVLINAGADLTKVNNHEQDFLNILEIIINLEKDVALKNKLTTGYQQLLQTIKKKNPYQLFGKGNNLLHIAVMAQDALLVAALLAERIINPNNQNAYGSTPLHIAATFPFGDRTIFNQLLNHGANPNMQTEVGNTALHLAAKNFRGDDFAINKLLEYHANTEIYNNEGNTPIHIMLLNLQELIKEYAQIKREKGITQENLQKKFDELKNAALALFTLLTHTQNKNRQDNFGNTPLYYLVLFSDPKASTNFPLPEIKELLKPLLQMLFLDKSTKPNIQNREGFTALHAAVGLKDADLVKLLIDNGADPFVKSFTRPRTNAEIRSGQLPPPNKTPREMTEEIKKGLPKEKQSALSTIELILEGEKNLEPHLSDIVPQQQSSLSRDPSPIPQEPSPTTLPKKDSLLVKALRNLSRSLEQLRKSMF